MVSGLTRDLFKAYKQEYMFFRPSSYTDENGDVRTVIPSTPAATAELMWNPTKDAAVAQGYGLDLSSMMYAIVYGCPDIRIGDIVTINGIVYSVVGIRTYNTHWIVDVSSEEGNGV